MEKILPLIVAVLYSLTAIVHYNKSEYSSMALWFTYALGNIFMIMAITKD